MLFEHFGLSFVEISYVNSIELQETLVYALKDSVAHSRMYDLSTHLLKQSIFIILIRKVFPNESKTSLNFKKLAKRDLKFRRGCIAFTRIALSSCRFAAK